MELFWQLVAEVCLGFGWESLSESRRDRPKANPVMACIGYILVGIFLGGISAWLFPHRWSQNDGLSMIAVVLNPVVAGMVLNQYGERRRRLGRPTTNLATFAGGACLAFGISAARFVLVVVLRGA